MLQWLRKKKTEINAQTHGRRSLTEPAARMVLACDEMDKHTLMHCIVSVLADRVDAGEIKEQDISLLMLRLQCLTPVSQTPRPERK